VFRPIFREIGKVIRAIGKVVNSIFKAIGKVFKVIGKAIGKIFNSIFKGIKKSFGVIGKLLGNIFTVIRRRVLSPIRDAINYLGNLSYRFLVFVDPVFHLLLIEIFEKRIVHPIWRVFSFLLRQIWNNIIFKILEAIKMAFLRLYNPPGVTINSSTMNILPGRHVYRNEKHYYIMKDKQQYSVQLTNSMSCSVQAELRIDGTIMGKFMCSPKTTYNIERPADSAGCFTFVKEEGQFFRPGEPQANFEGSVVEARFIPVVFEQPKPRERNITADYGRQSRSMDSAFGGGQEIQDGQEEDEEQEQNEGEVYVSGKTVFTGESEQQMWAVQQGFKLLHNQSTVIRVHLVAVK